MGGGKGIYIHMKLKGGLFHGASLTEEGSLLFPFCCLYLFQSLDSEPLDWSRDDLMDGQ